MASDATRSCAELVQTLGSSSSSSEQQRTAAAELLALPMSPQTWITAVEAVPALVKLLTQPAGTRATRELAMLALRHISGYAHQDTSTVRTASGGIVTAFVQLIQHSREDVAAMAAMTLANLVFNSDNQRQAMEAGAIPALVHLIKSSAAMLFALTSSTRPL